MAFFPVKLIPVTIPETTVWKQEEMVMKKSLKDLLYRCLSVVLCLSIVMPSGWVSARAEQAETDGTSFQDEENPGVVQGEYLQVDPKADISPEG